ncbi:MAG: hypothetical protein E7054_03760 [Lentisphaerae bacterium]|nr:hypothetical protein [Lentisphaerota bacterium]
MINMKMKFAFATVLLAVGTITTANSALPVKESVYTSPMLIGPRQRVLPHTRIFARIQPYDLYGNYLDEWLDRPLYHSRNYRDMNPAIGFQRDAQAVMEYGIAGFTMLGNAYASRYPDALRMLKSHPVPGLQFMAGMSWGGQKERFIANARYAKASPLTFKINGRIVFFPYLSPRGNALANIREYYRQGGVDDPIFFCGFWPDIFAEYNNNRGRVSDAKVEKLKKQVVALLDKFDGITVTDYHMHRSPETDYPLIRSFYYKLNRDYLGPLVAEAYAQRPGRLLGYDIRHGYIGHMSGTNEAELGTSQFRHAMDGALHLNPDIVSLVEWNEANENTSFQPTVLNSRSFQRLIRYYADFLNGKSPSPNPGDDLSIPNLVVSVRRTVPVGEKYRIEILNIPDGSTDKIRFKLNFNDENGKTLWRSQWKEFDPSKLSDITYTFPSENISGVQTVTPVIEIDYRNKIRRFTCRHTRIEYNHNWDMKEILMPLRDMFAPEEFKFEITRKNGIDHASVKLTAPRNLRAVEILDRDREIYAFGEKFDRNSRDIVTLQLSAPGSLMTDCRITVENSSNFQFQPWGRPYAGFGRIVKMDNRLFGNMLAWATGSKLVLALPRDVKAVNVEFGEIGSSRLTVDELRKLKKFSVPLGGHRFLTWEMRQRLFDHPYDINKKSVEFNVQLPREYGSTGIYHLRAIDMNGNIFRSEVRICKDSKDETVLKQPVYSAVERKTVAAEINADRIETLDYKFSPEHGALLICNDKPAYDAALGNGYRYCYSMWNNGVPKQVKCTAPAWEKQPDGKWGLKFDGKGNYISFPMDTLPVGAFTLEFSCRPESAENMALFSQTSYQPGGLHLLINQGKLQAAFSHMGRNLLNPSAVFKTELPIAVNQWNDIRAVYDLKQLTLTVNGKSCTVPLSLRAAKPTPAVFGLVRRDNVILQKAAAPKPFKGVLRSFKIIRGIR